MQPYYLLLLLTIDKNNPLFKKRYSDFEISRLLYISFYLIEIYQKKYISYQTLMIAHNTNTQKRLKTDMPLLIGKERQMERIIIFLFLFSHCIFFFISSREVFPGPLLFWSTLEY